MNLPQVVSRADWLAARKELLVKEKEATRARDRLNTRRRLLPMVLIDKEYRFDGPDGGASLLDLFAGRRQLIVVHFMFDPSWEDGCPSCSADADERADGLFRHLHTRSTSLVQVSRAPLPAIEAYRAKRGWTFPWYSSFGSDFNYDFHATLDAAVAPPEYNYQAVELTEPGERPGASCFLRDGDAVFHTYSTYGRGTDFFSSAYYYLDLTALGRQEEWEEPKGRAGDVRGAIPDFAT